MAPGTFQPTDLRNVPYDEVVRRIERARELDLRTADFRSVWRAVALALDGYQTQYLDSIFTAIWRARKNPPGVHFTNARELWYPPASLVKVGRLNDAEEPVLYTSSIPATAAGEIRPMPGDVVTLLVICPRNGVAKLGFAHLGLANSKAIEIERVSADLPRNGSILKRTLQTQVNIDKWMRIDDYICEVFTARVGDGEEWRYRASVAIASMFFDMPDACGINYPSVATDFRGINMCFRPVVADRNLVPRQAIEIEIVELTAHSLRLRPLRCAPSILGDGTIEWRGLDRLGEINGWGYYSK